jgi:hypothetical protein
MSCVLRHVSNREKKSVESLGGCGTCDKAVLNKVEAGRGNEWGVSLLISCLGKHTLFRVDDGIYHQREATKKGSAVFSSFPRGNRVDSQPAVMVVAAVGKTAAAPRQHSTGSSHLTILEHPIAAVVAAVVVDPF